MIKLLRISFLVFLFIFSFNFFLTAQWVQAEGPYGGGTTCLAVRGITVYAGTISRIYASIDGGLTWENRSSGLPTTYIYSINPGAAPGSDMFAGTFEGIFRSTNEGLNWSSSNNGIATENVFAVAGIDNYLFAGTMNGVYRSVNNGDSWTRVDTGFTSSFVTKLAVSAPYLFTGTDDGVYMSSDYGNTWISADSGITGGAVNAMGVNGNKVYAGTGEGVFVTENWGTTWTSVSNGLNPPSVYSLGIFPDKMFAGVKSNGAFVSTDQGSSWNPVHTSLNNPYVNGFAETFNNYYAATDDGIYLSTDGGVLWSRESQGIISTSIRDFLNLGSTVITGTFGAGAFISSNSGDEWETYPNLNARGIRAFAKSNTALFAATTTNGLLKSTDDGLTWDEVITPGRDSYFRTVGANGDLVLAVSFSSGAFRSTDNGTNWEPLSPTLSDPEIENFTFTGTDIFASTTYSGFIFRSTDQGLTWTQSSNGLSPFSSTHDIIILDGNLYSASGDGVYRSEDNGNSWMLAINGMTSTSILAIASYGSALFAGTIDGALYRSTNGGDNWTDIGEGLPPAGYTSANEVFGIAGDYLLCGTYSTGVYRRPLSEIVTSAEDLTNIPAAFELLQNYPNPFNPSTTISFYLPKEEFVSLTVYNSLGEKAVVLINESKPAGVYNIGFRGGNLSSGVYFYRLKAGNYSSVKKMILNK